ncbi:hypothetical protein HPB50_015435 [Hyalomma asiaticum]|uniref:Uncharacterized protein n=1 Tax=Hyalomma asiaticum TaxID=266040 RepID=A0ACB7TIG2_HYAAI|nr:hypothetical protein HPB50_015435 [Hyalomma asiaticum]
MQIQKNSCTTTCASHARQHHFTGEQHGEVCDGGGVVEQVIRGRHAFSRSHPQAADLSRRRDRVPEPRLRLPAVGGHVASHDASTPITPRHSRSAATRVTPGLVTYSHATLACHATCHTVRWTASVGLQSEPGVLGAHRSRASSLSIREARHWRDTTANGRARLRDPGRGLRPTPTNGIRMRYIMRESGGRKGGRRFLLPGVAREIRRNQTISDHRRSAKECAGKNLEKTLHGNTKESVTSYETKHWRAGPG